MLTIAIILISVLLVVAAIGYALSRGVRQSWQETADKLGLEYTGGIFGNPELSGTYDGYRVKLVQYASKRGDGLTEYFIKFSDPLPTILKLEPHGPHMRLDLLASAQDVEIGIDELDEHFVIKAEEPDEARAFLTDERIAQILLELRHRYPHMTLESGQLKVRRQGTQTIEEKRATFDEMVAYAETLSSR